MTRNRSLLLAVLVGGGVLFLCRSASVADENAVDGFKADLVQAAKDTLEHVQESYKVGRGTAEDIYRWSHRLMEAEKGGPDGEKAAAQHALRMRELHTMMVARQRVGTALRGEVSATMYYLETALSEQP